MKFAAGEQTLQRNKKMSEILHQLYLSPESGIDGLVPVCEKPPEDISLAEQRVLNETRKISKDIDFVFFRRFSKSDVRTSQPVAYIIDNTSGKLDNGRLARLHHALWLNGTVPLLYVDNADGVDILSCVAGPAARKVRYWDYLPLDKICKGAGNTGEQIKRFYAFRLADGTFWENGLNREYIDRRASSRNLLLEKIEQADKEINGMAYPLARRLLLLTIFIKYLEDRGVFKATEGFFSEYSAGANSFYEVLRRGIVKNIEGLFKCLEDRFNGDIFALKKKEKSGSLTQKLIKKTADAIDVDTDRNGQLYFWGIYNFKYIPIEVISQVFQCFTRSKKNACLTPVLLADLMLDQVMALEELKGDKKIFDPACGSGIFLVAAFRRLVFVNQQRKNSLLDAQELMELLHTSIYGADLQEEAVYITAVCLVMAVCDTLRPDTVWEKLKIGKLIEKNIFAGNIGKRDEAAAKAARSNTAGRSKKVFDIILGNPPFMENPEAAVTKTKKKSRKKSRKNIPPKQPDYCTMINRAKNYLRENGRLCMIQRCGFLYDSNTSLLSMRSGFFGEFTVNKILDFVSVNWLFDDENIKYLVIQSQKKRPSDKNKIMHLTFRGTISIDEEICFEPNHYDYHYVSQKEAMDKKFIWKANLLGGGRLNQLVNHLKVVPPIKDFIKSNEWYMREGLKTGKSGARIKQDDWLYNKPLLTSSALSSHRIDKQMLARTDTGRIQPTKTEFAFLPPLVILSKFNFLEAVFWDDGFLAYTDEFVGIKASGDDEKKELEIFFEKFIKNIQTLRACLLLRGSGTLTGGNHTKDIMNLPWPQDGSFDLLPWETELLDDVRDYMDDYVKHGRRSKLLKNKAADTDLENYSQTFLRLINRSYQKMRIIKYVRSETLVFMFFSFSKTDDPLPEIDSFDGAQTAQSIGSNEHARLLQTMHVTRILTGNTLIIIKPDNLRYWIRSTAIMDVDDTITDILLKRKKRR